MTLDLRLLTSFVKVSSIGSHKLCRMCNFLHHLHAQALIDTASGCQPDRVSTNSISARIVQKDWL